ncbi:unnamed protein product [Haemonchus placei]|uniref:Flavin-containing monooxygenase n=1 Tax=Haemonchus placei TaxID=6290 RepID=A0A0N4VWQ8_HAEPC|nr:unnamed protein product [Haemonchus placei]
MRVCVVGAGVSGLPSIKACKEQGLDVVCYEKTSDLGGLWNYRPNQKDTIGKTLSYSGHFQIGGTVMASTVVNTSKEIMAYSDFPPPEEWPNFMHHSKVNEYLHLYADHFDLKRHIRFNTSVKHISEEGDGFKVELENGEVNHFDKVLLCTGHHAEPKHPQLRDVEKFKGKIMHAYDYRDSKGFENKNVFLLGIGNSALDIAVDLAKIAKSVSFSQNPF